MCNYNGNLKSGGMFMNILWENDCEPNVFVTNSLDHTYANVEAWRFFGTCSMVVPIFDVVSWDVLILGLVTMGGKSKGHVIASTNATRG
jgi:hypothetical protein